jgi:hypothetical protein
MIIVAVVAATYGMIVARKKEVVRIMKLVICSQMRVVVKKGWLQFSGKDRIMLSSGE